MSSHNDGSYTLWDVSGTEPKDQPTTPYGPFPCKAISKLLWRQTDKYVLNNLVIKHIEPLT